MAPGHSEAAISDKGSAAIRRGNHEEIQRPVRQVMETHSSTYRGPQQFGDDRNFEEQATRYEEGLGHARATLAPYGMRENLPRLARKQSKPYFDDDYGDDFEMETPYSSMYTASHPQYDDPHSKAPLFSHDDLVNPRSTLDRPVLTQASSGRRPLPARRSSPPHDQERPLPPRPARSGQSFRGTDEELAPSRYSGAPMPWNTNKQPPALTQEEVSDAALLKRGLKRGKGEKVIKRGYGDNAPENIAIVNRKEHEELSFEQITKVLNEQRIRDGRDPTLTICGVNGRYNRTAPLLFSAQGKQFIPLSKRRAIERREGNHRSGGELSEAPVFDDETDVILVQCVKEVEAQKWFQVAQLFAERTGLPMNPKSAAIRHGML